MNNQKFFKELEEQSQNLRKICLLIGKAGGENAAHIGGALSCIDFIACANKFFCYSSSKKRMESLVLSKGHACLSLYALLVDSDFVAIDELTNTFEKNRSRFLGHPCRNKELGISFSTGSLGNGLGHAAGKALFRLKNDFSENHELPICCVVGDGECNEGIIWETFEFISNIKITNLIIFIDCNGWQQTQKSLYSYDDYSSFLKRLSSYDFHLYQINGHSHKEIIDVLKEKNDKPKLIIGRTIKGKGFEIFENNNEWHHGVITQSIIENL